MILTLLLGLLLQLPGLWFLDAPDVRRGLVENDAITFSIPVEKLPAGTYVQFGVCLENLGDKAPRHYKVEVEQGRDWVCITEPVYNDGLADHSFITVSSADRHPSTYQDIFRLRKTVKDSLRVRCRVCSPYAVDRSILSRDEQDNAVELKGRQYVAARLNPLGTKIPMLTQSVLLIGNSFTYFYGEPLMLQEIAFSQGLWLDVHTSLKGGQTFRDHTGLQMTLRSTSREVYDYAFIQGQSQEPAQYASDLVAGRDVKLALCELCDHIREVSPECSIFVEQTWAYAAGDCGGFGSMESFDALLADGTAKLALAGRAGVNPVGPAFAAVRADGSPVNLFFPDNKHQGLAGSYLKACVTYLKISGKAFHGAVPSCGLPEDDAAYLRSIAEKIVL